MRKIDMTPACDPIDMPMRNRLYAHGETIYAEHYDISGLNAVNRAVAIHHMEVIYGNIPGGDDIIFMVDRIQ